MALGSRCSTSSRWARAAMMLLAPLAARACSNLKVLAAREPYEDVAP